MTDTQAPKKPGPMRLAPIVTLDAKFFWDNAKDGKFTFEKCTDCGEFRFPPRPMCPHCHSIKREPVELSGKGTVYSWIRPQHPRAIGFAEPPIAGVIELQEGFRMVSNIVGCEYENITADMPVEVEFVETMGKKQVPVFRVVGGQ